MSSYSLSPCFFFYLGCSNETRRGPCLVTASFITHPSLHPLLIPPSLSPFHLSHFLFPPFLLSTISSSLPHFSLHPLLLPWGLAGPVQGAAAVVCCCVCVCRPLFTLIIGIGSVLLGFQAASTGTSLNQSWKQESCEARLPTSSCPNSPDI